MKLLYLLLPALVTFGLLSCTKDICNREVTYTKATAIYEDLDNLRLPIVSDYQAEIIQPSKIFVSGDYLFVSEEDHGIHILDNTDTRNPRQMNFIAIPGNKDLIIKDDRLLADSYYDILVIDVQDPLNPRLLSRNEEVFPVSFHNGEDVLVGFKYEEVTERVDCQSRFFDGEMFFFDHNNNLIAPAAVPVSFSGARSQQGTQAGSLSRMANVDDFVYIISESSIFTFQLLGDRIEPRSNDRLGRNFETIFPLNDHLFIGAQNGMHIMDISNRTSPVYISQFQHPTACDPVYPTEDVAYVTLRTGNACEGTLNQLDVIALDPIQRPSLIESIAMENPHGLTLFKDKLVVCEGEGGIKIFDASNPTDLSLLHEDHSFTAYDVIAHPDKEGILLIIGDQGLVQFEVDAENELSELSTIGF